MVVKTAQVWTQSKIPREMLCFTIETAAGGREGRMCPTGGCGLCPRYARAMLALCSRYVRARSQSGTLTVRALQTGGMYFVKLIAPQAILPLERCNKSVGTTYRSLGR